MKKRHKRGTGTQVHSKGYLRVCKGVCKNLYVHRIVAAAWLGRELKKDEQVHHRNGDKLDPRHGNLLIVGEKDHGWVSAKQAYFMMNVREVEDKREWEKFMDEQAAIQAQEILVSRSTGNPVQIVDGKLEEAWESEA